MVQLPRGSRLQYLAQSGLIGKLHIESNMGQEQLNNEIRSIFCDVMGHKKDFKFCFLQPAGGWSMTLFVPKLSKSFKWTPGQVANLAKTNGKIYILAQDELNLPSDEVS